MGGASLIELPFPPASLSGHNTGHWRKKSSVVAKHREWARLATLASNAVAPEDGIIRLSVDFYPPNRRGDAINFLVRMKPYFDGIADALGVNDARFRPLFDWHEPIKGGKVVVAIAGEAQRATTTEIGVVHEHATREAGDAQ